MTLDDALQNIASVHQQHSIKCFLAIKELKNKFDWPESEWLTIGSLTKLEEPNFGIDILQNNNVHFNVVSSRRHWILSHAIYPYAYFTMQEWFQSDEATNIFNYYLSQCSDNNEYLNHNISVLFAFIDAWHLIITEDQKLRFIERFCEFVTATFYGNNHTSFALPSHLNLITKPDCKAVLDACLINPGFWGHNLIALASICKQELSICCKIKNKLLKNLHEQCFWEFEDDEDNPIIHYKSPQETSNKSLELSCRQLLLGKPSNLHQITLAESITFLFSKNWVKNSQKSNLVDVLDYYSRQC